MADRLEDVTPPERVEADAGCDREVALYGFLRGAPLRAGARLHLAGVGDFSVRCRAPPRPAALRPAPRVGSDVLGFAAHVHGKP